MSQSLPLVHSISVLDVVLIALAGTLFLDLANRPVDTGYPALFWVLCTPLAISILSLAWSQDRAATLRAVLGYAEGLIAYLLVIRELAGVPSARVIRYIKRYNYLLIAPAVLLLLRVPGFQPRVDLRHTTGDYLTYFSRLSHPVLGPSNNLATALAFFAPILLYWGHTRSDRRASRAGLISMLAIVLTLSRGILLAFLIAGLLYAPLNVGRRRRAARGLGVKIAAAVGLGAAALGVFYAVNGPTHALFKDRLSTANLTTRAEIYSEALKKVASNPLIGRGGGVTESLPPTQSNQQPVRLDLYAASAAATLPATAQQRANVHNTFLQQAVYFGLPLGLIVSLALCGIAGFFLARRRTRPLAGAIGYALMAQLVSFLFESSFEGTVLRLLFYLSVGLATALLRSVEEESRLTASAAR
jgi:O-antigen ligase